MIWQLMKPVLPFIVTVVLAGNVFAAPQTSPAPNVSVKKSPTGALDPMIVGLGYFQFTDYRRALAQFQEAIRRDPKNHTAWYFSGNSYFALKQYDEAVKAFKQATVLNPQYAEAFGGLGFALDQVGSEDEALAALQSAVRLKPNYPLAYLGMGGIYLQLGDREAAVAQYNILKPLDAKLAGELNRMITEYGKT